MTTETYRSDYGVEHRMKRVHEMDKSIQGDGAIVVEQS